MVDEIEREAGAEVRHKTDQQVQQVLSKPELTADRAHTAKEIVFNIGEWKHRTNVVDYRGGDTLRKPIDKGVRKSMEDLTDDPDEADRVLSYVVGARALRSHDITDFESFKAAFRDAFMRGGKASHARLWDAIGGQEDLLLKFYSQSQVQDKVTRDSKNGRVTQLMQQYKIPRHQANQLFDQIRIHEVQLIQEGLLPVAEREQFVIPAALAPTTPRRTQIAQVTRSGGTMYRRSVPVPFTEPQVRFIRNNSQGVPIKKLTAMYNSLFPQSIRTQSSVSTKKYRILKRGEQA